MKTLHEVNVEQASAIMEIVGKRGEIDVQNRADFFRHLHVEQQEEQGRGCGEIPKENMKTIERLPSLERKGFEEKSGDDTKTPHFVSRSPVGTEKPDFRRPEYFGKPGFT